MDYNEYGGAPIMGVAKPVFKIHGSAKASTVKNALRLTPGLRPVRHHRADRASGREKSGKEEGQGHAATWKITKS